MIATNKFGAAIESSVAPLFSLQDADVGYPDHVVLQQVTLCIYPGEKVALLGPSGSGKSTLLQRLRIQQPMTVSWCPQESGLVPMLSVYNNIYMGTLERHSTWRNLLNLIKPRRAMVNEVRELSASLGLENLLWRPVEQLSGGQQQRVNIGRAILQQGDCLLADEPVSALDRQQATEILTQLQQRFTTLVIALHDVQLAVSTCDRIIGIKNRQVCIDAQAAEVDAADLQRLYD